MGLDMSIQYGDSNDNDKDYELWKRRELAYWRKHPDLHGYIVSTFAGGIDECQVIPLTLVDVKNIRDAVDRNALPPTTGFFFGESLPEYREYTLELLDKVIGFMKEHPEEKVYYQASW